MANIVGWGRPQLVGRPQQEDTTDAKAIHRHDEPNKKGGTNQQVTCQSTSFTKQPNEVRLVINESVVILIAV